MKLMLIGPPRAIIIITVEIDITAMDANTVLP